MAEDAHAMTEHAADAAAHAEHALTPASYISHHLTYSTHAVGDGAFWTLHVDTVITTVLISLMVFGFLWWVVRGATAGVPGKRQAFIEMSVEFVNNQVRSMFNHDIKFVAPLALTTFVLVLFLNAMDFLPIDWVAGAASLAGFHEFRPVPTADLNTTVALALSVWLLMIFFSVKVKGLGGWLHELTCTPFGPLLFIFNILFNAVEYLSKPLSHSLRLFGNIYAGEIIFLLLWVWAANSAWDKDWFIGAVASALLGAGWALFHLLIVPLQAFIFMMLTIVYISMAHEHH